MPFLHISEVGLYLERKMSMRICSFSELKNKEVVNVCDGKRLGYVTDAEIDVECGRVISLIMPSESRLFSLSRCEPVRVLWCDIECIGDDVILVRRAEAIPPKCGKKNECGC